jgi:hypothetical protein
MSDVPLPPPPGYYPQTNVPVWTADQMHAHAAAVSADLREENARLREQLALAESVRAAQVAGLTEGAEKLREALREVIESPSVWDHYSIARAALKGEAG